MSTLQLHDTPSHDLSRVRVLGGRGPGESAYADLPTLDMGDARTRYFISLDVADEPGVLAAVATEFARHHVSIETVRQQQLTGDEHDTEERAELVIVTHAAADSALGATVEALGALPQVREVSSVMRVEGE